MECKYYPGLKVGDRVTIELFPPYRIQYRPTFFTKKEVTKMQNAKVAKVYPDRIVVAFVYKEFSMTPKYGIVRRVFDKKAIEGKITNIATLLGRRQG